MDTAKVHNVGKGMGFFSIPTCMGRYHELGVFFWLSDGVVAGSLALVSMVRSVDMQLEALTWWGEIDSTLLTYTTVDLPYPVCRERGILTRVRRSFT